MRMHRRHRRDVALEVAGGADHLRRRGRCRRWSARRRGRTGRSPSRLQVRPRSPSSASRLQCISHLLLRRLVELELFSQVDADARHDQRMRVGRRDQRQAAHARAAARVLRQQRRLRLGLLEVLHDRHRLEQRRPAVVEHQRRHHRLRVDRLVVGLVLHALEEVDRHFVDLHALQRERHLDAVGRERTPEAVEFHAFGGITGSRT